MKLEWRKIPLRFRFADSEFGQYRIVGRAGVTRKLHVESCDGQCLNQDCDFHTVATAQQACQSDYDARVAAIALANGYVKLANDDVVVKRLKNGEVCFGAVDVDKMAKHFGYSKLEPGQVVVQVEDLARIVTWFKGDARTVPHTDMDTTLNRFTAAIDASNKE